MMATTETLRGVLRTSRGQPILKLQFAEKRASLALDLLSLGSRSALGVSFLLSVSDRLGFYGDPSERGVPGEHSSIFGLRGQGKCVLTSIGDTLSRHGRDGAGAPIWRYAGARTRDAVGGFRQLGLALPIRFSDCDLVWDQVAIRLLCIRCDVLRPLSGSGRLEIDGPSTPYYDPPRGGETCITLPLRKTSDLGASKSSYGSVTPLGRCHATDHPSEIFRNDFVSSVATTGTLEGHLPSK